MAVPARCEIIDVIERVRAAGELPAVAINVLNELAARHEHAQVELAA